MSNIIAAMTRKKMTKAPNESLLLSQPPSLPQSTYAQPLSGLPLVDLVPGVVRIVEGPLGTRREERPQL